MVSGSGTSGDPYILSSFADLELIGTTGYETSKYFKLGANIDASPTADPGYESGAGWVPRSSLSGSFDGDGYTISGLYINRPTTDGVGLFTACTGTIKNITMANVNITGQSNTAALSGSGGGTFQYCVVSGSINGYNYVGGVLGYSNRGGAGGAWLLAMSYCSSSATITGNSNVGGILGGSNFYGVNGYLNYCSNTGTINGINNVGGILGFFGYYAGSSYITNSSIAGTINCSGNQAGGLAGQTCGRVENTNSTALVTVNGSATSDYIGGMIGQAVLYGSSGTHCLNVLTGDIEVKVNGNTCIGGVLGYSAFTGVRISINTIDVNGEISGNSYVGGLVGDGGVYNAGTIITSCTVIGSVTGTGDYIGGIAGRMSGSITDITLTDELEIVSEATSNYVGGLIGSVRLSGPPGFLIISLDECHVSLDLQGYQYVGGLIGKAGDGNNGIAGNIDTCSYVGTLVGTNYVAGLIGYSTLTSSFPIILSFSRGSIIATGNYIGGLFGYARGIQPINCYSQMDVEGNQYIAGLVGNLTHSLSVITNCYSCGVVNGDSNAGGMVGAIEDIPTAIHSYWDSEASGQATSALGTPLTSDQMKCLGG